jgi:hypothetical protein
VPVELPVSNAQPQPRPDKPVFLTIKRDLSLAIGDDSAPREKLQTDLDHPPAMIANNGLFPHLSAADNIGFGVEGRSAQQSKRVTELMEMVALDPAMGRAGLTNCPAASSSAWHWSEHCFNVLGLCCSMSRSPRSILGCAPPRARRLAIC